MAQNKTSGNVLLDEEELEEVRTAVKDGTCTKLVEYLASGWNVNQPLAELGETALHLAAGEGGTEVVRVLVQGGADVDVRDKGGWTPLHMAAWRGHTDTVKVLLANKASVDVRDVYGRTQLYMAAQSGYTDTVEVMLANKASVDVRDDVFGQTPLHWAAGGGHTNTVKVLLANKASVDVRDWLGNTPLHVASAGGHTEIVKLLCMESGCDVNTVNEYNKTAFDVCGEYCSNDNDDVERTKTILKKHMKLQLGRQRQGCAFEVRHLATEGATAGSPDQTLVANAGPIDEQKHLELERQRQDCAVEVLPRALEGATAGSSDQTLQASAGPTEEHVGTVLESFSKSKGNTNTEGEVHDKVEENETDFDVCEGHSGIGYVKRMRNFLEKNMDKVVGLKVYHLPLEERPRFHMTKL